MKIGSYEERRVHYDLEAFVAEDQFKAGSCFQIGREKRHPTKGRSYNYTRGCLLLFGTHASPVIIREPKAARYSKRWQHARGQTVGVHDVIQMDSSPFAISQFFCR